MEDNLIVDEDHLELKKGGNVTNGGIPEFIEGTNSTVTKSQMKNQRKKRNYISKANFNQMEIKYHQLEENHEKQKL